MVHRIVLVAGFLDRGRFHLPVAHDKTAIMQGAQQPFCLFLGQWLAKRRPIFENIASLDLQAGEFSGQRVYIHRNLHRSPTGSERNSFPH